MLAIRSDHPLSWLKGYRIDYLSDPDHFIAMWRHLAKVEWRPDAARRTILLAHGNAS